MTASASVANVESNLAARIGFERNKRGWSYETLSKELGRAGCAIAVSSLNGIEKGEPRRRVRVNEMYAFAQVFGLPAADLVAPPATYRGIELRERLDEYLVVATRARTLRLEMERVEHAIADRLGVLSPGDRDAVVAEWAASRGLDGDAGASLLQPCYRKARYVQQEE